MRRALAWPVLAVGVVFLANACDGNGRVAHPMLTGPKPVYLYGDSAGGDTVPCTTWDVGHCPLTVPVDTQAQAIMDGIDDILPGCGGMETFLLRLYSHGDINMYAGFQMQGDTTTFADSHRFITGTDTTARMHINSTDNYAYIHWIIRHEAAHLMYSFPGTPTGEEEADSVANACGLDQKPYN